jgi:hypothetical protein
MGWLQQARGSTLRLLKLRAPLLCETKSGLLEGDPGLECGAATSAAPPAELFQFALGDSEPFRCSVALPLELLTPPGEETRGRVALR